MIQNTLNNHLTYWYNDDENQRWRKDPNDYTSMRVGGCSRAPFSAKIEWTRIARLLIDQYPDLTIFMSGGLDSEIALRCFLAAGIKPKLATIRFPNDKNAYDIAPMIDMVQREWGLDVSVIDFDPEEFCLSGEYLAIAEKYQAYTFYQQILLKVAEDYSAPMITVDEVELEKLPAVNYDTGEVMWHWTFLKKEDQDGDQIPFKLSWTSSKMKIYSEAGFKFRMRPKWHGMENYMHLWDFVKSNQPTRLLGCNPQSYTIPALELEENLAKGRISQCSIL
jgi:hypothetical protein